jgi:hypothetical protein
METQTKIKVFLFFTTHLLYLPRRWVNLCPCLLNINPQACQARVSVIKAYLPI